MLHIINLKFIMRYLLILVALLSTSSAMSQTTLTATDGTMTITGELLGFDDNEYRIKTATGELMIRRVFVNCAGIGCPEEEATEQTDSDQIVLKSDDGRINLKGTLVDLTSTEFIVDTATGRLTVRREFVTCEGELCPSSDIISDRFMVSVSSADAADLVTAIVGDYAAAKDFNLTQQLGDDAQLPTLLVGNERGVEVSRIDIQQMDTAEAVNALFVGTSEFAITREQITPEFLATLMSDATGDTEDFLINSILGLTVDDIQDYLSEEIIGLDAISFVVGNSRGIDVISMDTAQAVLDGQITNWAELGGADEQIAVHMIADNQGLIEQLRERGMINSESIEGATLHASVDALNAAIREDGNGLGVMYRSQASDVKSLNLQSACKIFFDDSDFSVQTEEYPLTVRWYQYSRKEGDSSEFARNVRQYIPTDVGQQTIASSGMVTQQLQIVSMQDQGSRILSTVLASGDDQSANRIMKQYFGEAANARRISTSMRFGTGNAVLDSKAQSDVNRISDIIRSSEYEGYEVLVFGFSDSVGGLENNIALSRRRANSVKEILLHDNSGYLESDSVTSIGIGPIAPVGCNQTAQGRTENRRVEVWIRPRA